MGGIILNSATKASPSPLLSSHLNPLTLAHGEATGLAGHFLGCTLIWGTIYRAFLRGSETQGTRLQLDLGSDSESQPGRDLVTLGTVSLWFFIL